MHYVNIAKTLGVHIMEWTSLNLVFPDGTMERMRQIKKTSVLPTTIRALAIKYILEGLERDEKKAAKNEAV
jgi:hypothetical protein